LLLDFAELTLAAKWARWIGFLVMPGVFSAYLVVGVADLEVKRREILGFGHAQAVSIFCYRLTLLMIIFMIVLGRRRGGIREESKLFEARFIREESELFAAGFLFSGAMVSAFFCSVISGQDEKFLVPTFISLAAFATLMS
jgi:hypothetical protein